MAVTPESIRVSVDIIDALGIERQETWRRATVEDDGKTHVHDAQVVVCKGGVVVVTDEVIHALLAMCGFERVAADTEAALAEPPC